MDIPPDLTISITDLRKAGHCARMGRFFRSYGLTAEYMAMLKGQPMSAAKLAETGDPRAIRAVRLKIEAMNDG